MTLSSPWARIRGARDEVLSGVGDAEQLLGVQAASNCQGSSDCVRSGDADSSRRTNWRLVRVVILGEHLWRNRFDADPAIVGRIVTLTSVTSTQGANVILAFAQRVLPSVSSLWVQSSLA